MKTIKIGKGEKKKEAAAIKEAVSILKNNGLIVFPSDTVYGLGVDPTNKQAVNKLFQIKSRQLDKAVSVFVADRKMAGKYVRLDKITKNFYDNFLPGPFTVVAKIVEPTCLQPLIYSYKKTLGVRVPGFPFLTELAQEFGGLITATSANISGKSPHYTADGFLQTLSAKRKKLIDLVIDMGKLPRHKPSTVVDLSEGEISQLRAGDIGFGQGKKYLSGSPNKTKQIAREIVQKYYRPDKLLFIAMIGELGAGKTTFCQGVGESFGINRVNSPTFVVSKEYKILHGIFHHIDAYRLESGQELVDIGFKKMLRPGNIVAIEWAEKVKDFILKEKNIDIVWLFFESQAEKKREITVFGK